MANTENNPVSFESCFNHFISNNFKEAYYAFSDNYYKHPSRIDLLYGIVISYIMLDNIKECVHFLEKEVAVSPLKNKINLLTNFIKLNSNFSDLSKVSTIFNIGLFLKKKGLLSEAKIFFRTCQVLEPDNAKTLTVLGECALIEKDLRKGITLFSQAAKK
ncbi:MAG: hypothetical protein GY754_26235 [bacterium]|nr:hypothetical protein [bacterium]